MSAGTCEASKERSKLWTCWGPKVTPLGKVDLCVFDLTKVDLRATSDALPTISTLLLDSLSRDGSNLVHDAQQLVNRLGQQSLTS